MMKKILFSISLLITLILTSCEQSVFTPKSSGRPYEMLVVIDKDMWERPAGRAIYDVLDSNVPGLPQCERSFRISNVAPEHFDRILKICRNVITVDVKPIYTQPKLKFVRDVFAAPQVIMTIQAPSEEGLAEYVAKNKQVILDFFVKTEMNREIVNLKKKHSEPVLNKVDSIFGCTVWVPSDLQRYKVGKNFLWSSTDRATSDMNFVMYSYPYRDTNTFTLDYFIHKRDSVMKINIPGARPGMYMATDARFVDVKNINVKGEYALEARGLWQMEGDMMGGPFVSHARVDQANGRVVVVEGFIYSPDRLNRNLIRMMEASLYTLSLPQEQQLEEIVIGPGVSEEKQDSTVTLN